MPIGSTTFTTSGGVPARPPGQPAMGTKLLDGELREALGLPPVSQTGVQQGQSLDGTPNGLGKDDFLKLLLAQLANQDPLRPMEDREFIAQLAQLNSLEQLQQMNQHLVDALSSQMLGQAIALLGRQVETAGAWLQGEVTAVTMADGVPWLTLDTGDVITLSDVSRVLSGAQGAGPEVADHGAGSQMGGTP
jgi:flagellar basal-body rod modification protein FlgD